MHGYIVQTAACPCASAMQVFIASRGGTWRTTPGGAKVDCHDAFGRYCSQKPRPHRGSQCRVITRVHAV